MNTGGISEFLHQSKKSFGSFVSREQSLVNKSQGSRAEVKKLANLTGAILKPDNLLGSLGSGPEKTAMVKRKIDEEVRSHIHSFIFSSSVENRTYWATEQEI